MKFQLFLSALVGFTLSQDASSSSSSSPAQSSSAPAAVISEFQKCINEKNCKDDVACSASCANVPNPSPDQIAKTTECVAKCQTEKESAECQVKCMPGFLEHASISHAASGSASGSRSASKSGSANAKESGDAEGSDAMSSHAPSYVAFLAGLALYQSL